MASPTWSSTRQVARPATKRFQPSDWRPLEATVDMVVQRRDGTDRLRDHDDNDDDVGQRTHVYALTVDIQYRDEWSSRLHVWHTNRLRQQHRRTSLTTFNSSLSMVDVISVRLPTEHSLFHTHVPLSATVLLSQDRACGTVYRPL